MAGAISYPPIPLFEVGPFTLSMHGLMAGVGFVLGAWVMLRLVKRRGFNDAAVTSALTWALVGAIVGARLFTIPAHLGDPGYGIDDVVDPAGFYSIMGGFAGGIIAGLVRLRMLKLRFLPQLDLAAFGLAVGTIVGRTGDLFIVEHLGGETDFFLGYTLKPGYDIAPQHGALERLCDVEGICGTFHHAALYDLLGAAVLLGVLVWLARKWRGWHYGQLFAVWAGWYGVQRFLIDFTRNDNFVDFPAGVAPNVDATLGPLTWSQWSGLAVVAGAVALFVVLGRRAKRVTPEHDVEMG
ncbi:MAG: prolipoprotein diacylglyceryl transferase, partial [Acidimicrobiia bacterium]